MRLDERYVPYLQMAGLYHLARLNDRWFRLDEPLVSAFVERWRPETHTFHMPFGECTITLQDVAYQLGLPVDGDYVSGCLTDFHLYIEGGRPAWQWFHELLSVLPPENQVQKFAVNCTWFQETFAECPDGADEETVRRFARAYIMMLLGTQLFADKSGNRIHIRWLPYVARLEEMGRYSWGSAALAWLYRCMCRVANRHVVKLAGPLQLLQSWIFWRFPTLRPSGYDEISWPLASRWSGYNPGISNKGPRVQMARLKIDLLQPRQFIWMPYSALDVIQVVHPEVLEPRHTMLWRCRTSLIYFAVVEWHQVDRVLPQFGGVQPTPSPALNINFLMSKDGRGGDHWFPAHYAEWHLHWQERAEHILQFDIVPDPGPSHDFLTWWYQHGKRFLSPEMLLGDPRGIPILDEATQRGAGRLPDMDRVEDVPDRRRIERRARVGTRRSQREWNGVDLAMDDVDHPVRGGGRVRGRGGRRRVGAAREGAQMPRGGDVAGVDRAHQGGHEGGSRGSGMGDPTTHTDAGVGGGGLGDYFVGVPGDDHTLQESTPWVSPGSMFGDLLASDGIVAEFGGPHFLDDIRTIMQEDEAAAGRVQTTGTQAPLDVDLNEPTTVAPAHPFAMGGTPASAQTIGSHSVAGPSSSRPVHVAPVTPRQPVPDDSDESIEDEEPLIRRSFRTRLPRRCGTGSHLFR
ncbi:serine/threonine-protein phosphatase 7 long form homolog [Arachis hypogaea]|uniref:serine/threonine-protein phosphatase 7 long form homolog n=1 Tax=Arachis hypogaea TaxID=3818 RepID=UPI003B2162AA